MNEYSGERETARCKVVHEQRDQYEYQQHYDRELNLDNR